MSPPPPSSDHWANVRADMIGFALVLLASLGICASLNIQKLVHVRNTDPATGEPMANFMTLPLWWVGCVLNALSELLNLAALGWAPATLVTPLGCLTVVFNAIAANVFLGEPWLQRDLLGIFLIFVGVMCVVWSQVGAPSPPITPEYLHEHMLCASTPGQPHGARACVSFWLLVFGAAATLAFIYFGGLHAKYCQRTCWIYLGESSLIACFTVLSARVFASFLPHPMPGKWEYFTHAPDCFYTYGALLVLIVTAVGGLLLQNAALMYFKASEVVPIYFCMFALAGVAGSGLAFGELRMPWVLMLFPGVGFCIMGVFAISHRRDERIAERCAAREAEADGVGQGGDPRHSGGGLRRTTGGASGSGRRTAADVPAGDGSVSASLRASALGLHESGRGVSELSTASVASAAALEEAAFLALGGMSFGSTISAYRMSRADRIAASRESSGGLPGLSSSLLANPDGALAEDRLHRGGFGARGRAESTEQLSMPMCRVSEASSSGVRHTGGADEDEPRSGGAERDGPHGDHMYERRTRD